MDKLKSMAFDLDTERWFRILAFSSAGISLLSNTCQLYFYCSIPEVRTFFVRLLFYLAICDWLYGLCIFLSVWSDGNDASIICHIQAVFQQFFCTASYMWMAAAALTMYMTVVKEKHYMWKFYPIYHIVIWPVIPFITTIVMVVADQKQWSTIQFNRMSSIIML